MIDRILKDDDAFRRAERLFAEAEAMAALAPDEADTSDRPSFQDVVNMVLLGEMDRAETIMRYARSDLTVRRNLEAMVRRRGGRYAGALAAASGETVEERMVDDIHLSLRIPEDESGLTYLLITLPEHGTIPTMLLASNDSISIQRPLPDSYEGRIQIMLKADDPLIALVRDHTSSILIL